MKMNENYRAYIDNIQEKPITNNIAENYKVTVLGKIQLTCGICVLLSHFEVHLEFIS